MSQVYKNYLLITQYYKQLAEPKFGRAKRIRVWVNGDHLNPCTDVIINPNFLRTWNSVLRHLTNTLTPSFGAVRKLISLHTKKKVNCFDDVEPGEKYLVLGNNCKLKTRGYKTLSELELLKPKKIKTRFYSGEIDPGKTKFLAETGKRRLTIIFVFVNGQLCHEPVKVVLNERDLLNWDVTLEYLAKILDVPDGIETICTIFGDTLLGPEELQHGYAYVALPFNERFEKADYMSVFAKQKSKLFTTSIMSSSEKGDSKSNSTGKQYSVKSFRSKKSASPNISKAASLPSKKSVSASLPSKKSAISGAVSLPSQKSVSPNISGAESASHTSKSVSLRSKAVTLDQQSRSKNYSDQQSAFSTPSSSAKGEPERQSSSSSQKLSTGSRRLSRRCTYEDEVTEIKIPRGESDTDATVTRCETERNASQKLPECYGPPGPNEPKQLYKAKHVSQLCYCMCASAKDSHLENEVTKENSSLTYSRFASTEVTNQVENESQTPYEKKAFVSTGTVHSKSPMVSEQPESGELERTKSPSTFQPNTVEQTVSKPQVTVYLASMLGEEKPTGYEAGGRPRIVSDEPSFIIEPHPEDESLVPKPLKRITSRDGTLSGNEEEIVLAETQFEYDSPEDKKVINVILSKHHDAPEITGSKISFASIKSGQPKNEKAILTSSTHTETPATYIAERLNADENESQVSGCEQIIKVDEMDGYFKTNNFGEYDTSNEGNFLVANAGQQPLSKFYQVQYVNGKVAKPILPGTNVGNGAVFSDATIPMEKKRKPSIHIKNRTDIKLCGCQKHGKFCLLKSDDKSSTSLSESPFSSSGTGSDKEKRVSKCYFCYAKGRRKSSVLKSPHHFNNYNTKRNSKYVVEQIPLVRKPIHELDRSNVPERDNEIFGHAKSPKKICVKNVENLVKCNIRM
ncbi:hypothetical protein JTB14_017430 [Gonioctena quinquepunctata]|nr:hypothetical protein JTB14_017430 [Gonioctena quinquepunctata]